MVSADDLRSVPLFQLLDEEALAVVAERISVRRLQNDETLFRRGDPGDSMYIVRFGEVEVLIPDPNGVEQVRARLGRNEIFGEMALLTGDPRSASIVANLDTELLVLTREAFHELFRRYPAVVMKVLEILTDRLRRTSAGERERKRVRTLCCHSALGDSDTSFLSAHLAASMARESGKKVALLNLQPLSAGEVAGPSRGRWDDLLGALEQVKAADIPSFLSQTEGGVDVLQPPSGGRLQALPPDEFPRLLSRLREAYEFTLVATAGDPSLRGITQKAMDQSELVLFAIASDGLEEAARQWKEYSGAVPSLSKSARLLLRRGPGKIEGLFDRVESMFGAGFAHQVRVEPEAERDFARRGAPGPAAGGSEWERSLRRMARQMAGLAVGLALGGGGARGLAHIGVLDVFEKEGVPVDLIGGTSIGSIVAALYAKGFSIDEMRTLCKSHIIDRKPLNDYTFPRTALLRGRKVERTLREIYGDDRIEELSISYFSVGADLISGREVVIDRGPLWQSVRASMSLPGILPPVRYLDRYLLVDGGVANNVPGDVLKRRGAEFCIAVNIAPERGSYFNFKEPKPCGWLGRLLRRSRALRDFLDSPTLMRVIMRSVNASSIEITNMRSQNFDIHLLPAVGEFDLFDFNKLETLVQIGREAASERLPEIRKKLEALKG